MADNTKTPIVAGNLNQTFPLPKQLTVTIEDRTYRFCLHCHTPKPVAQVPLDGKRPGVCVNCINGINNYDKLVAAGKLSARPGTKIQKIQVVKLVKVVEDTEA